MNNRLRTAGVALALTATVAMTSVASAQQDGYASRVDLDYKDADLYSATHALTMRTGTKFLIAATDEEFKPITLSIDNVTPDDAIRYICEAAGAYWELDLNGVYIIRYGEQPTVEDPVLVIKEPSLTQKIMLVRAGPRTVYQQLFGSTDLRSLIEIKNTEAVASFKQSSTIPTAPLIVVSPGATSQVINPMVSNTASPDRITLPGEEGARQVGGFGGGGRGGFGGGQGGGGFGGGQGGFGGGGQLGDLSQFVGGTGIVPDGITSVQYDPTDNSLIVTGQADAIRELELLIALFDKAPKQVVIKVEFITTSTSLDRSLGIDWFYQRGSVFAGSRPGTFARASDPIFLNYSTGNIQTRLRTLLTEGWGRTVTSPMVRTMNNQPATVFNSVQTTIFINQVVSGVGGVIITPNPVTITATTFLSITPRINGDDTITMYLTPQVSGFGQLKRGPDGQEIPDILTQFIQVVARVKNGETIALGGMTNKVDNYSESRIPILSDLPIIGQLFRGRNTNTNTSELIIFVTPTIVEDDNYGLGP